MNSNQSLAWLKEHVASGVKLRPTLKLLEENSYVCQNVTNKVSRRDNSLDYILCTKKTDRSVIGFKTVSVLLCVDKEEIVIRVNYNTNSIML